MANRTAGGERSQEERSRLINIRIKPADRALIDQAAAAQGKEAVGIHARGVTACRRGGAA